MSIFKVSCLAAFKAPRHAFRGAISFLTLMTLTFPRR